MSIYLDNASTVKPKEEVINAMMPYFIENWYNPSSLYSKAADVKKDIELSKKKIADFINADNNEIFFTSGGSESNCMAIDGFCKECIFNNETFVVITTKIEHKSIMECIKNSLCGVLGVNEFIPVSENGFVILSKLEEELEWYSVRSNKILVSIQMANNEIGTIQNIKKISELVHKYNAVLHVDAVQSFGIIDIDVKELGIDMLSASGHKIGCPKGIGILYKNSKLNIQPLIYGSQMDGLRGGTECVPYIIGMGKAVELCSQNMNQKRILLTDRREYMIKQLVDNFGCKVNGDRVDRLPNNINVTFPQNITGESLLYMLDLSKIYISTGSACNSRSITPSYVLKSIGLTDEEAIKTIRISISDDVTYKDIDYVIDEIKKSIQLIS